MNSRKRIKVVVITLALFVLGFIGYWHFFADVEQSTASSDLSISIAQSPSPNSTSEAVGSTTARISALTFKQCSEMLTENVSAENQWLREHYESWEHYLDQGYSLDEVTLAVEYFGNSNFAESFRTAQLRKYSTLAIFNENAKTQIEASFPSISSTLPFLRFERKVPLPAVMEFFSLPAEQQEQTLQDLDYSIDDVAYLLLDEQRTDTEILSFINRLPNLQATVGYDKFSAVSLLDYAVISSRPEIVEILLKSGMQPTADNYLASTMEWALNRLWHAWDPEGTQNAVNIVQQIQAFQNEARFDSRNESEILGFFPRGFYQFDQQRITNIAQTYGLDLRSIQPRNVLTVDSDNQLIQTLASERAQALMEEYKLDDTQIAYCRGFNQTVEQKWQAESVSKAVDRIIARYPGDIDRITTELSRLDPSALDYFRANHIVQRRQLKPVEGQDKHLRPLSEGKIQSVIDYFLGLHLNEKEKNWVALQIVMWEPSAYDELIASDFFTDGLEHYELANWNKINPLSLDALEVSGYQLRDADSAGKTLVFYAAKIADVDLLKLMYEENYPYQLNDEGEDPLHIALRDSRGDFAINLLVKVIAQIMPFAPSINSFHLRRMAVVKLKYPTVYQQIIEQYPQLTVSDDTDLPNVF